MNKSASKILPVLVAAFMLLSGCKSNSLAETQAVTEMTTETTTVTTTTVLTTTEEIQEVPYMEQFKDIIVELPPEGYEEPIDGVTYSEFRKYKYYSSTAERDTNVNVLLPPDYSEDKEYPVLYIMHGFYDNEDWMTRSVVNLSTIYGNLLASGEAEEMIIVLPYIFCDKDMPYCTGMDIANCLAYDNFINDLTTDLMPFIESEFSVAKGRENTAITGFSMGGRESLYIGYKLQNQIGYVGAIAPAPGLTPGNDFSGAHQGMISESEFKFAQDPKVLMICCGTSDSVVGTFPKTYHDILTRNGENHYWWEIQGSDHGDPAITNGLYNFCKAIFK